MVKDYPVSVRVGSGHVDIFLQSLPITLPPKNDEMVKSSVDEEEGLSRGVYGRRTLVAVESDADAWDGEELVCRR